MSYWPLFVCCIISSLIAVFWHEVFGDLMFVFDIYIITQCFDHNFLQKWQKLENLKITMTKCFQKNKQSKFSEKNWNQKVKNEKKKIMEMIKSCVSNHHMYDINMFCSTPKSSRYGDGHRSNKQKSQNKFKNKNKLNKHTVKHHTNIKITLQKINHELHKHKHLLCD